jgi:hypothetical protein
MAEVARYCPQALLQKRRQTTHALAANNEKYEQQLLAKTSSPLGSICGCFSHSQVGLQTE